MLFSFGHRGGGTKVWDGSLMPPKVGSNVPADRAVQCFRRHGAEGSAPEDRDRLCGGIII